MLFIGADQITSDGSTINKIGSWGIAFAARSVGDPVYVVTPSLKLEIDSHKDNVKIEMRDAREVWPDAPEKLKIINPAFEVIDSELITGYITELGIIDPKDIASVVKQNYSWLEFE
ncbi:MAG TPA: hypothetical protein ENN64_00805 [bacterium]|nr:hypothetical protein [bacterium]